MLNKEKSETTDKGANFATNAGVVVVCGKTYTKDTGNGAADFPQHLKQIFESYPFELDHFQKYSIEAIEEGAHVLLTASTGSGKTLPAEYAIQKFCRNVGHSVHNAFGFDGSLRKKVIYTAPIKSLSNQKFYEFTDKYPDISFGILTGDIKFNPEADCIIMTTEILRNLLFRADTGGGSIADSDFQLNIDKIACVIFDEIHYINDRDRGKVWEETIIKLPRDIQMVMLSATIDRAAEFAKWIATIKEKSVWLASTETRVVPLTHYSFWKCGKGLLKKVKDTTLRTTLESINGELQIIKKQSGPTNTNTIERLHKIEKAISSIGAKINNKYTLNQVCDYLHINQMLPAITFVFSRKKVLEYAKSIEWSLYGGDEQHLPATVEKECKHILMKKLPNYQEYIDLPEYQDLIKLLKKGVAVHHSGILPVLKEMVEMLFSKGYIKMLFATETFAVGVNMPTKTVLFTGLTKFDGNSPRVLLSHEYTQMAGRAGRRGLDTVGYVVHLNGMFDCPSRNEYIGMLDGKPQTLSSKFEIDFSLLLRVMSTGNDLSEITKLSMINGELRREYEIAEAEVDQLKEQLEKSQAALDSIQTSRQLLNDYIALKNKHECAINNQRKKIQKQIITLERANNTLAKDYHKWSSSQDLAKSVTKKSQELDNIQNYIFNTIATITDTLEKNSFITGTGTTIPTNATKNAKQLTTKGVIASKIQELNCLVVSEALLNGDFDQLDASELTAVFSALVDIRVPDNHKQYQCQNQTLNCTLKKLDQLYEKYYNIEMNAIGWCREEEYTINYDLPDVVLDWCNAKSDEQCKELLQEASNKDIFLGEFVKAILKINNIANELSGVCDVTGNIDLKHKLSKIPELTLKFIATNQSLYV